MHLERSVRQVDHVLHVLHDAIERLEMLLLKWSSLEQVRRKVRSHPTISDPGRLAVIFDQLEWFGEGFSEPQEILLTAQKCIHDLRVKMRASSLADQ